MWFSSWLRIRHWSAVRRFGNASTPIRKKATFQPHLETLDERIVPSLIPSANYAVGPNPQVVVTADVNGDGKLDLVTANAGTYNSTTGTYSGGGVSVLLGTGAKGGFKPAVNYAVASGPGAVAVADFNSDGKPDIISANNNGSVSILIGNGDGTFRPASQASASGAGFLVVTDINHDGKLDLITYAGSTVSTLFGNGAGAFHAGPTTTATGTIVATGDFNGDGKIDLVTENTTSLGGFTLSIMTGNADGTFASTPAFFFSGDTCRFGAATAADFNGDGKLDLAFTYEYYGPSGFPTSYTTGVVLLGPVGGPAVHGFSLDPHVNQLANLVAVDLNRDGKLDLATLDTSGNLYLLPGHGDGNFGAEQVISGFFATSSHPYLAVGDFNGDGYADLVGFVADYSSGGVVSPSLEVWLNDRHWRNFF